MQSHEEIMHWTQAISLFREVLEGDWDGNTDAVLGTSFFLNSLAFIDVRPTTVPRIASELRLFGWLRVQLGFTQLIWRASLRSTSNVWLPFFRSSVPDAVWFYDERPGTVGIPDRFVELYEVTEVSTCDTHTYLRPLRRICRILQIEKKPENTIRFIQFVQGMSTNFAQLLEDLDPRALLLCSYWLGCMCCTNLWWTRNRSLNECRSICAFLMKARPGWIELLEFPAVCSGFWLCRT